MKPALAPFAPSVNLASMDQQHLRDLLAQLHNELAHGETLDDRSRQLLQSVHADIERVAATPSAVTADEHPQVRGRLQEAALTFQTTHPQLAANLEQTMNALSNLGL